MNGKCRRTVLSVATRTSFMRRGLRRVCRSASLESPMFRAFFFSSRRRHTRLTCDWSSDVWSSDLALDAVADRWFVAEVGLEDQPERAGRAACRAVDEVEIRAQDAVHAFLVVVGARQRFLDRTAERLGL